MKKVPEHVIAEIRDRTDLVELIGGYVSLKRAGRNFVGLCPFHREKTPSFNVSPERGIYHCFGCGVTGDAIRFLTEHDHLSFPEALRQLARRAGIELVRFEEEGAPREEHDHLYRAHALAAALYRRILKEPIGRTAAAEIERRGLSPAIVDEYRLGASADAWDRLLTEARKEGLRPELLERAGLAIRRESGSGWYDRFRGRLMFPIEVAGGKTVGFGGRVLGEGEPKYLNSPETPLFRKRKTLYGVPQAFDTFREKREAILVEGYTDVLALSNVGVRGAVAALGTAFTPEHAGWLARNVDKVIALFDGDEAGSRATVASCGPLLGAGLAVRVVRMPSGEDPDSFVRGAGAAALREILEKAPGVVEALLGQEAYTGPEGMERAVSRVLEALAPIEDPLRREVYMEDLAKRTGLPLALLERRLVSLQQELARTRERVAARETAAGREGPEPAAPVVAAGARAAARAEREAAGPPPPVELTAVAIALHDAALGAQLLSRFDASTFEHPLTRRIAAKAREMAEQGTALGTGALLDAFADDEAARKLLGELAVSEAYAMETARQAEDCAARLARRGLEHEMERVTTEMRKAQARGDDDSVREFAQRKSDLARGIAKLVASRVTSFE
ncbi:MAG: DNA primase [bacterium]